MKHIHSPHIRSLVLVFGSLILVLLASYLVANVNDAYVGNQPDFWLERQKNAIATGKQLAVLKSSATGVVYGDVHRDSSTQTVSLDVAFSGIPLPGSDSNYNLYFGKKDQTDRLFVARFGQPHKADGISTFRLTGWGPHTWLEYDTVFVVEDHGSGNLKTILEGPFVESL